MGVVCHVLSCWGILGWCDHAFMWQILGRHHPIWISTFHVCSLLNGEFSRSKTNVPFREGKSVDVMALGLTGGELKQENTTTIGLFAPPTPQIIQNQAMGVSSKEGHPQIFTVF